MSSGVSYTRTGAIIGETGVAKEVRKVGFRPRRVELLNLDSGDRAMWQQGMADGTMAKTVAAGATTIVSDGITPLSDGFELGVDADLNADDETVYYTCWQ